MKTDPVDKTILDGWGGQGLALFKILARESIDPEELVEIASGSVPGWIRRRLDSGRNPPVMKTAAPQPGCRPSIVPTITKVSAPITPVISQTITPIIGLEIRSGTKYGVAQEMWDRFWRSEAQRLSASGKSQREVAEELGVSQGLVSRWLKRP